MGNELHDTDENTATIEVLERHQFDVSKLQDFMHENVDGFEGEGDFLSKFGVEIRDRITFSVARRTFSETVEAEQNITRPREGDLIYLPLNGKTFSV